ncbi:uncharacterized protein LOC114535523 [Dendronephthya gigantea]|uniref:uncharacterized protein LOC114535523 n=2 Tax=Dendronephthya gigantea TaxID=151771 RepID=UPI00106C2390|nr:uncharacterized protein LOC114535523 [Dendronephthya gigantea]
MNDDLRAQNMNMSCSISDLKMANKNLENEKSSLLTALKLFQNDSQHTSMTNTVISKDGEINIEPACEIIHNNEVTQLNHESDQPVIYSQPNAKESLTKKSKKKSKKTKSKPSAHNTSQLNAPDANTSGSGGIANTSNIETTRQGQNSQKQSVVIAGDSIVKNIIGPKMNAEDPNHYFIVKPFPGATVTDMEDFVKPLTRRTPDKMILHVGTNDLRSHCTPKVIADSIVNIVTQVKEDSPGTDVGISAILVRSDNHDLTVKATQVNNILKGYCIRNKIPFLSNSNMNESHLNTKGLHLNRQGSLALQQNFLDFAKSISD